MRILLTGATGFLGSYLLERLVAENHELSILKRASSDTWRVNHLLSKIKIYDVDHDGIEKVFDDNKIDLVINTVTSYGRSQEKISEIVNTNLLFCLKLLETAVHYKVRSFINTDTLLQRNINAYALSKKQFVDWLNFFSNRIQVINMKIEHMYGPKDDRTKFIGWLIGELKQNKPEIGLTSGEQKRDFIFIDDIVDAYLMVINVAENLSSFEEYDIGTGEQVKVKEFVEKLYREAQLRLHFTTQLKFGAIPYRQGEQMEVNEDVSRIKALGWLPLVNLDTGIKKTVEEML